MVRKTIKRRILLNKKQQQKLCGNLKRRKRIRGIILDRMRATDKWLSILVAKKGKRKRGKDKKPRKNVNKKRRGPKKGGRRGRRRRQWVDGDSDEEQKIESILGMDKY